jgi:CRISPR-associated exonuclease Cas4
VSVNSDQILFSDLQHWQYCPRQCGLIHLEQVFDDNLSSK